MEKGDLQPAPRECATLTAYEAGTEPLQRLLDLCQLSQAGWFRRCETRHRHERTSPLDRQPRLESNEVAPVEGKSPKLLSNADATPLATRQFIHGH
jgi:hypothetical protein